MPHIDRPCMLIATLAVAILASGLAATALLRRTSPPMEAVAAAMRADLVSLRADLSAARDSTDVQIAAATKLLDWLEGTEEASSGSLVSTLTRLLEPRRPTVRLTTVAALAAPGGLGALAGPGALSGTRVLGRLLDLDRRLALLQSSDPPGLERYRVQLEEGLSPGMWRYVFLAQSGTHPVDFRASLGELHANHFDRTMRSLLRGFADWRAELDALEAEAASISASMEASEREGEDP